MHNMFVKAYSANPNVSQWDTTQVTNAGGMFHGAISAQPNMSLWNVGNIKFLSGIFGFFDFQHIAIPPHLYDATLKSFSQQDVNPRVDFDAGHSQYCHSADERVLLVDQYDWEIEDGGQNCGVDLSIQLSDFQENFTVNSLQNVTLKVENTGFEDADDVIISTLFSDGLEDLKWSCEVVTGFAECPMDQGYGNLNQILDLAQGDQLRYQFEFSVSAHDEYYAQASIELNTDIDIFQDDNHTFISQTAVNVFSDTSGAWFDEDHPGHGIFLNVLDGSEGEPDQLLMYWFTHHQDKPVWFYGVGDLNKYSSVAVIKLYNTAGTDFPPEFSAEDLEVKHWGWAVLDFTRPDSLNFTWNHDPVPRTFDGSYGHPFDSPIQLTQLSTVSDSIEGCYSGTFYNPDESGHGLYIHVTDAVNDQRQINVSWFVYHQGEQLWLIGSDLINEDGSAEISLNQLSGASFFDPDSISGWSFNQDDLVQSTWGELNLQYVDENNIEIEYLPSNTEQFISGQMHMTRITTMLGHDCNNP